MVSSLAAIMYIVTGKSEFIICEMDIFVWDGCLCDMMSVWDEFSGMMLCEMIFCEMIVCGRFSVE